MICSRADLVTVLGISAAADLRLLNMIHADVEWLVKDFLGTGIEQATFTEYYPDPTFGPIPDRLADTDTYTISAGKAIPVEAGRYDGQMLRLRNVPVRSVTSVHENDAAWDQATSGTPSFPSGTLLTQGTDYIADFKEAGLCTTGFLIRRSGQWTTLERCIQVVYVAGWTATELNTRFPRARMAIRAAVIQKFGEIKTQQSSASGSSGGVITSESLDGWSASYDVSSTSERYGLVEQLPPAAARILEPAMNYAKYLG